MKLQKFEDIIAWQKAQDFTVEIYAVFKDNKDWDFRNQVCRASVSISNNIAEGSGSFSDNEFASFLNISRRSVFECANILQIFLHRNIIDANEKNIIYSQLVVLSKKITNFRKALQTN